MKVYIGSYTRMGGPGIAVCHWENGELSHISSVRHLNDTTWVLLSEDEKTLYAAGSNPETNQGAVAAYRVDGDNLELVSIQPTGGNACCHLALSKDGAYLYAANYLSGSVSVFPVSGAEISPRIQLVERAGSGPHPTRQEAAHTHQCVFRPGTSELFVCDLGTDHVAVYEQDAKTGLLSLLQEIVMPGGMGPRHLIFANENLFYVTGELDNVVRRVALIGGEWTITGEMPTLPEGWQGESTSAAIRLEEGALWVSNRGHDSLCCIELDKDGNMLSARCTPTGGQCPRDFMFVPGGILFAHQSGGGLIASTGACAPMDGIVCVCPAWKNN